MQKKTKSAKKSDEKKENIGDTLQSKINEALESSFDMVIAERKKYYTNNVRPAIHDVDAIIQKYSYINAGISAAANIVPGPWGLLTVIPEIVAVIRNQLSMIYDIAAAHGKDKITDKTLLMAVFAVGVGGGALGLLLIHGGKVIVKRASLRVLQKIIIMLGGQITQRVLKAVVAKWLPIVGAAAMAVWAKIATTTIGKRANEIYSKDIEKSDEPVSE